MLDLQLRVGGGKGDQRGDYRAAAVFDGGGQAQGAAQALVTLARRFDGTLRFAEHALAVFIKAPPHVGQRQAARAAREQRHAQLRLQLFQIKTDDSLALAQHGGRRRQ
ncbi:hypothetical protein D3C72_1388490 [compost metagenome]